MWMNPQNCHIKLQLPIPTPLTPLPTPQMDIQMPLLNGFQATERIRLLESQSQSQKSTPTTPPADPKPRTPIVAISASLEESRKDEYSQKGVDGWMLKPVNFGRLERLLRGIHDEEVKNELRYQTNTWEHGGWLVT
jgi:CheY-like chemotaxis protein